MSGLSIDRFRDYFEALHERCPYSWQSRLAALAVEGKWPGAIDLPTGSGKTACIDIAIFALACQAGRPVGERTAPRRIFFTVNRRVIVDEAYQRALKIARRLWDAERNSASAPVVLRDVAAALRQSAGTKASSPAPPLDVIELRGGIYRENRWARSATQPTVLCTTVDQLGSRLLFRGYGVSPNAAPIQAALVAYDSLVLLDEAHISEPFRQTLDRVQNYLDPEAHWAADVIGPRPLIFVPMTATPPAKLNPDDVIRLDHDDRENESLMRRLSARKPALLRLVPDIKKAAVQAAGRAAEGEPVAVGIIVNRVGTARAIHDTLRTTHPDADVELVIGSMRPIDRDWQTERLESMIGGRRSRKTEKSSFTIATQCLECGADFDFDLLISECSSLDSLRQRFGRLNRGGRPILAGAIILANDRDIKPDDALDVNKPLDPIYGNALARTWNWLSDHSHEAAPEDVPAWAQERTGRATTKAKPATTDQAAEASAIDFGIDAFDTLLREHAEDGRIPRDLLAPSASLNAPIMLPAYIDCWCQTSPAPVPDPDVALFIHGPQARESDVQVCWRDDLVDGAAWCDVVALLPPTAAECMSVSISRVRRWLSKQEDESVSDCDLLDVHEEVDPNGTEPPSTISGVLWRGAKSSVMLNSPQDIRPGDTLVLPTSVGGWESLGHVPERPQFSRLSTDQPNTVDAFVVESVVQIDVSEAAFQRAREKAALRLHPARTVAAVTAVFAALHEKAALRPRPARLSSLPNSPEIATLIERVGNADDPPTLDELRGLMKAAAGSLTDEDETLRSKLQLFSEPNCAFIREPYPDDRGIVITSRRRLETSTSWFLPPPLDEGDDESSRTGRERPVWLANHTEHVCTTLCRILELLPTGDLSHAFQLAAERHDWGKVDERFQAMLCRTAPADSWSLVGELRTFRAKSDAIPQTPSERQKARELSGLPSGFRHEMLSVQLAARADNLPSDPAKRDLILHLIAAHHGYGRPFAPVVVDRDPPDVEIEGVALLSRYRRECPPHSLDSGIAERFWSLTRRYGWWRLAYLESLLRLADQQASADEDAGKYDE